VLALKHVIIQRDREVNSSSLMPIEQVFIFSIDSMKEGILSKLAMQIAKFYAQASEAALQVNIFPQVGV
jgi:hypothetical protein